METKEEELGLFEIIAHSTTGFLSIYLCFELYQKKVIRPLNIMSYWLV